MENNFGNSLRIANNRFFGRLPHAGQATVSALYFCQPVLENFYTFSDYLMIFSPNYPKYLPSFGKDTF
ncbi:MAG: hypothetical protein ABIR50_06760 [Ginsengibacter sp.]